MSAQQSQPRKEPLAETQAADKRIEYDDTVKFYLASLVRAEEYVTYDKNVTSVMPDEFSARLCDWCMAHKGFKPADVFTAFGYDNPLLSELHDYRGLPGDDSRKFKDVENELYRRVLVKEVEELTAMYESTKDNKYLVRAGAVNAELARYKKYRS